MRDAALPAALLCTAFGLALAFAPRRAWGSSLAALAVTSAVFAFSPAITGGLDFALLGCWMSAAASAGTVYLPRGVNSRGAFVLSLNTGFWSGVVVAFAGSRADLLKALPCALAFIPALLFVRRRAPIVVKVVSSWLIAVSILAATLPLLPVTPGYMPDHLD